jgi:ABC-type Fe3+/spermidine/putrescine transport system ATPase subunit
LTQLKGMEHRHPNQLSGGQQQRAALARALSLRPKVLLLDEPLGALDAKLRRSLQVELKDLQRRVGTTFIYVTHDQEEALAMSDRLAVMRAGRVEQLGTPSELYETPETRFVADFLGASNILSGRSHGRDRIELAGSDLRVADGHTHQSEQACVTIRPERVTVSPAESAESENYLPGTVDHMVYAGPAIRVMVRLADGQILHATAPNQGETLPYRVGDQVRAQLPPTALKVLAEDSDFGLGELEVGRRQPHP